MSAINPASFVTPPTAGLQGTPTSMANPLYGQDAAHADRRQQQDGRAYPGTRDDVGREAMANPVGVLRSAYADAYPSFAPPSRHVDGAAADPFGPYSPTSFGALETGFSAYQVGDMGSNSAARIPSAQGEWAGRFQGLSLNS